jgi:hypothetical protein
MPRMRVAPKLECVACRHYKIEGNSLRCALDANTYSHWMGVAYYQHPDDKNLRGECKDYDEEVSK